jgi:sulfate adenylyltransferase
MMNVNAQETLLIEPYGGNLVDLMVADDEREQLLARAAQLPRLQLTPRNICDL